MISEIIERLRGRRIRTNADALNLLQVCEEAADEIVQLRGDLELRNQTACDRKEIIARLEAEIERLRVALKPFADAADTLVSYPNETKLDLAPITLGDLRTARHALEGK